MIVRLGASLISALPAQFLALLAINCVFVLGLLWFLERENASRERLLNRLPELLEACERAHTP